MEAIVHAGSAAAQLTRKRATDVEGTRRLLEAARAAGVGHLVYISIVGMEGVAYPYYRAKLAAEAIVKEGTVPWTILRATQFHTLMELFLGIFARPPGLMLVPYRWQFQPVDPSEVGARLAELAVGPAGRGCCPTSEAPRCDFRSLAESWRRARGLQQADAQPAPPVQGQPPSSPPATCSAPTTATARSPSSSIWSGSTGPRNY